LFFFSKLIKADISDAFEIADSVAAENESEYFRDKVVQLFAILEVRKIFTLGTTAVVSFLCARLYFAVQAHRLFAVTALTSSLQIHPAFRANQTAIRQYKFLRVFKSSIINDY
jgi:hypothetical protein